MLLPFFPLFRLLPFFPLFRFRFSVSAFYPYPAISFIATQSMEPWLHSRTISMSLIQIDWWNMFVLHNWIPKIQAWYHMGRQQWVNTTVYRLICPMGPDCFITGGKGVNFPRMQDLIALLFCAFGLFWGKLLVVKWFVLKTWVLLRVESNASKELWRI